MQKKSLLLVILGIVGIVGHTDALFAPGASGSDEDITLVRYLNTAKDYLSSGLKLPYGRHAVGAGSAALILWAANISYKRELKDKNKERRRIEGANFEPVEWSFGGLISHCFPSADKTIYTVGLIGGAAALLGEERFNAVVKGLTE